jgi:glycosyltransferase involved in cell wall biosynthesis
MRILFLIDWHLYYTAELANALSEQNDIMLITRDHNFEISSPDDPVSLDEFLKSALDGRIRRETLRYKRRAVRNLAEIVRIRAAIREFEPDVIHIQETVDWRILAVAASFKGKKKIVVTVHDVVSHLGETRGVQDIFWRILVRVADVVIVHGHFLKHQLLQRFPDLGRRVKIGVVPHGAYSIYRKWDSNGIPEEPNTILFFGRISKYKGIEALIEAHKLIRREIPDTRIILAGRGDDLSRYQCIMDDGSGFEIHNRFIPNSEVPRFFRRSSVVVLPYLEASQSGVVAIAYVFGKPVVVTDVGSIPEVIERGETGFIVPPNDPAALAAAIVRLLNDSDLRQRMGKAAMNKANGELSWRMIATKTMREYALPTHSKN